MAIQVHYQTMPHHEFKKAVDMGPFENILLHDQCHIGITNMINVLGSIFFAENPYEYD